MYLIREGKRRTLVLDGVSYKANTILLPEGDRPSSSYPFHVAFVGGSNIFYGVVLATGYVNAYSQSNGSMVPSGNQIVGSCTYYVD